MHNALEVVHERVSPVNPGQCCSRYFGSHLPTMAGDVLGLLAVLGLLDGKVFHQHVKRLVVGRDEGAAASGKGSNTSVERGRWQHVHVSHEGNGARTRT